MTFIGAEAVVRLTDSAEKERVRKTYRIKEIDEKLRLQRTRAEAKLLREARRAGVMTPQVIEENKFSIKMELIEGKKARDSVDRKNCLEIARKIAESVALLHTYGIIHGDLTTSNMIISKRKAQGSTETDFDLYFIDFGLGFFSHRPEDKATDLHLLRQSLISTHHEFCNRMWETILAGYKDGRVIKMLQKIEKRGRYVVRQ